MSIKYIYSFPAIMEAHKADDVYEDDYFTIYFPDLTKKEELPYIHAYSRRKAVKEAEEFLAITIGCMLDEKKEIPTPSQSDSLLLNKSQKLVVISVFLESYQELIQSYIKNRHFHPRYYENNEVIEGIALKNKEGKWDVYFDDFEDAGLFDVKIRKEEDYGIHLFTVEDENKADEKFKDWVENVLIPFRTKRTKK